MENHIQDVIFDSTLRDAQGTAVIPIAPEHFDLEAYQAYEQVLSDKNRQFLESSQGLLVYRRVRADGVFYDKCRDFRESLALQLGALKKSMEYKTDIANFLEPWYGIGYIAACFGGEYRWEAGQAPAVVPMFKSISQVLKSERIPIAETVPGRHMLEMIEYFLEKTKGKLPISFTDIQSPMNMLSYLLPATELFYEITDEPEQVAAAAKLVSELLIDFLKAQEKLIGGALARPGHGFGSSRIFRGTGMSNDMSIMMHADDYDQIFKTADELIGSSFGGTAYHSCGCWEKKIYMVKNYRNIFMADGAFTSETDADHNEPGIFGQAFSGSGIILNARAVGDADHAFAAFRQLWRQRQKLICVTYCTNPEEQALLYERLHEMERQTDAL